MNIGLWKQAVDNEYIPESPYADGGSGWERMRKNCSDFVSAALATINARKRRRMTGGVDLVGGYYGYSVEDTDCNCTEP